jgi:peroxiredoxin (alkyl hydroperoxide reductase subunit C)
MSLVGKNAPMIEGKAVVQDQIVDFSLSNYRGKYVVLFFYPLDFTFVCPTELHAFQERIEDFKNRQAELIGCSVDSCYSHLAWLKVPRSLGGIHGVEYPLLSDLSKKISKDYSVLNEQESIAYRGLFLIDKEGVVRHQLVNDLPLGRSVEEVLRTLDALNFHEQNGEVCPANWQKGQKAIAPNENGLKEYVSSLKK